MQALNTQKAAPVRSGFFHASEQVIDLGTVIHGIDDEHASGAVDVVQFLAVHDKAVFHHRDVVIRGAFGAGIDGRCRNLRHIAADIAHALHDADRAGRVGHFLRPARLIAFQTFARQLDRQRRNRHRDRKAHVGNAALVGHRQRAHHLDRAGLEGHDGRRDRAVERRRTGGWHAVLDGVNGAAFDLSVNWDAVHVFLLSGCIIDRIAGLAERHIELRVLHWRRDRRLDAPHELTERDVVRRIVVCPELARCLADNRADALQICQVVVLFLNHAVAHRQRHRVVNVEPVFELVAVT